MTTFFTDYTINFNQMDKFKKFFTVLTLLLPIVILSGCGDDQDEPDPNPTLMEKNTAPSGSHIVSSFMADGLSTEGGVQNGDEIEIIVSKLMLEYNGEEYYPTSYTLVLGNTALATTVTKHNELVYLKAKVENATSGKTQLKIKSRFEVPGYGWFYDSSASLIINVYDEKPEYDLRLSFGQINVKELEYTDANGEVVTKYQYEPLYPSYTYGLQEDPQAGEILCPIAEMRGIKYILFKLNFLSNFDGDVTIDNVYLDNEPIGRSLEYMLEYTSSMGKTGTIKVNYKVSGKCEGEDVSFVATRTFKLIFTEG